MCQAHPDSMETLMQEILPPHVQQAIDEAWAVNLEQQAAAWKAVRSERKSVNDGGVFVVRRPVRRSVSARSIATDSRRL